MEAINADTEASRVITTWRSPAIIKPINGYEIPPRSCQTRAEVYGFQDKITAATLTRFAYPKELLTSMLKPYSSVKKLQCITPAASYYTFIRIGTTTL